MTYNENTKALEVAFQEDYLPSWRLSKPGTVVKDRETFLRVLMTAQHISVGFLFDNELVKEVGLRHIVIEHARRNTESGSPAPVEMCKCPKDVNGLKCEVR